MPQSPYRRPRRTSARIPHREARYRASQRGRRRRRRPAHDLSWGPIVPCVGSVWTQATLIFLLRDTRSALAFPIRGKLKRFEGSERARYGRHFGLAIPGLAWRLVSAGRAAATLARALRTAVRYRGEQRDLLPAAGRGHVRELAGPGSRGLRDDREGQPVPDPRAPTARPGRAGQAAARRGRRAGRPARPRGAGGGGRPPRPGPAPAPAGPAGRRGPAAGLPAAVPGDRAGRGRATTPIVVDRRGARGARGGERGAVLDGPRRVRPDAAVAHRRLGVPAVPRGR